MLATGIVKVENISLNVQKKTGNQKGHLHVFNMSTGKGYKVSSLMYSWIWDYSNFLLISQILIMKLAYIFVNVMSVNLYY